MIDRLALGALVGGCVLLAGIVAIEIVQSPAAQTETGARAALSADPLPPTAPPERALRFDAMLTEILARPLFSATRRPPVHNDSPAADTSLSDTRLAGIVTAPGRRFAIFAPNGAKPLLVNEGDTVSGWRVDAITPREVSLSGPDGTKTLKPKNDPNLVPPAPPPVAAAAPAAASAVGPNRPAAVLPPRPGFPTPPLNRPPPRPGQLRQRR